MPALDVPYRRSLVLPADIDVREDQGDEFVLRGHAAVFDRLSEDLGGFREMLKRGSFRKPLDEGHDVRLLINHDGMPLARTKSGTLELREDPRGLHVYARIPVTEQTRALRVAMQRGDVDQMSFAFSLPADGSGEKWERGEDKAVVRKITQVERLLDVSVVTFPAYPQTDAQMRSVTPIFDGDPDLSEELALAGLAEDGDPTGNEARVALLADLQERSKRRLSIAQFT